VEQKTIDKAIEHLPIPSSVLRRINRVISKPDASGADVANALRFDPTLCGKVLRLANSAYIGLPHRVSSLPHAVVLLGIKRVHSLVLTSELIAPYKQSASLPFSIDRFRRHAVTVAYIAESIARHLKRYDAPDQHELFSGALLHDIGKLLAGAVDGEEVRKTYERAKKMKIPYYRAEREEFSHRALGLAIAEKWHFPPDLSACIRGHHTPACFPDQH
jgi:putative nucleotidyltransferase with HDIG domain